MPDKDDKNEFHDGGKEMTFLDHLEEMRTVILKSLVVLVIASIVSLAGFAYFNKLLMYPLNTAKTILGKYEQVFDSSETAENAKKTDSEKIGPVYIVPEGKTLEDVKSSGDGAFYIVAKDGALTLSPASANQQNNKWYSQIKLRSMSFATPIVLMFYIGIFGGLAISIPFIAYFFAKFIAPGLTNEEYSLMKPAAVVAVILFLIGACFSFFFMLPMGIAFMSWMSEGMGLDMFPDAQSYYDMVIFVTIAIGFTFELPLLEIILIYLGVLNPDWLRKNRRIVFLVIIVFAAVVTPPDCITQLSLAIPLYLLYEGALRIGVRLRRRKLAREEAERLAEEERERLEDLEDAKRRAALHQAQAEEMVNAKAEKRDYTPNPATNPENNPDYLPPDYDPNYVPPNPEDNSAYDIGDLYDFDPADDYVPRPYIDYGRLARTIPNFSPDWSLNKPDTSFFAPDWQLNADGLPAAERTASDNAEPPLPEENEPPSAAEDSDGKSEEEK